MVTIFLAATFWRFWVQKRVRPDRGGGHNPIRIWPILKKTGPFPPSPPLQKLGQAHRPPSFFFVSRATSLPSLFPITTDVPSSNRRRLLDGLHISSSRRRLSPNRHCSSFCRPPHCIGVKHLHEPHILPTKGGRGRRSQHLNPIAKLSGIFISDTSNRSSPVRGVRRPDPPTFCPASPIGFLCSRYLRPSPVLFQPVSSPPSNPRLVDETSDLL
ncbi:hypothetical protein SAY87_006416 [Trapa incisa]|uniref:Uncharacterized protein n=1 Tax=Trapa incisa TaxID=236973 RepID=A0AAN7PZ78_9MYRT|nr:hypothetical protein SAY87_006416 [Trapa incisa]